MMPVLHIEPLRYNVAVRQQLEAACEVDYVDVQTQEELQRVIQQKPYEALFVKLGLAIDQTLLARAPQLKYIITPTTGLNHIDMAAAEAMGIQVLSLKGETEFLKNIKSTAEHTWTLLLALIRRLPAAFEDVKAYNWQREPFLGMELNGKVLGIIGYGRLGTIVAEYGKAFGMEVWVTDTDPARMAGLAEQVQGKSLDEILTGSDVISLHIPWNDENQYFLDQQKIQKMKEGAVLVNTSRGEVVVEDALLQALQSGKLAGAATDVLDGDSTWELEIPARNALVEYAKIHTNLLITPHIGGYALESIEGTREFVAKKFLQSI